MRRERKVSKLQLFRAAIKRVITDAQIFPDAAVITERQTDIWRNVAVAVSAATHRCVLIIDTVIGDGTEQDGLEQDITIAVTILGPVNIPPGAEPEEVLFEDVLCELHGARPVYEGGSTHVNFRLRYQGWANASQIIPEESRPIVQLARQATFKAKFSLEPRN